MTANLQLIQDGISNNIVDNQKLINEYNDQLTKGTSIKNTDVSLVESLFNENYLKADATTNITNKTDIYLDKDAQKNTVNLVTHEDAHQAGFGEKSANALGWMGEAAFNVNSWVNSSNIDIAKTQIQNIPKVEVKGVNDAQAQLDLLKANTEKYESQIANNDEFDEHLTNKRFADLQKYLEICKSSPNANGCSQVDKNKLVAKIKQISADNLSVYKSCKASGESACMEKNVQQIWAAEQFDDNKLKQLLGSTNVGLASNYDVKAADPQLFKQLEFLQYAQKNCQGMSYGDCGTKYTVSHRSAAENILIPAKSKVLDYIVGEKPKSGASYYLAGIGYVATEILFPESGTDVALMAIGGAAGKGGKLAGTELKAESGLANAVEGSYVKLTNQAPEGLAICLNGVCFTAGTLIETDQGFKAVENFVGGERVWSRNDRTLEYGYRPVIATKETTDQVIFEVVIQNQQGQQEKLETTAEHPFWVKNFGWLKSSLLQSGMTLLDRNNEELTVVNQVLIPNKVETVYNIEVDGFHTYHVGELGTWVHNANCCDIKSTNAFVPVKPKLNYAVDIENKGHGLQNIDISTKQRFDEKGIPADTRTTKSFLYSSFDSKSGEFYIQKMEAYQKGNNTGKEMLSQAIEKIGYSKINSAKAELADTNKLAFENAYTKSGNTIEAVNNTPLGKAMNDLGFKVDSIDRNLGGMPKVKFIRK